MKQEKTLNEEIEYMNEISPDFIGDNPRKMREGTISPVGYIKAKKVKQTFKEILDEIENLDLKMAKEVMETEKTNNFDDFSEFAQGEVTARRIFAMDIKQIIKQKAGFDLE